MEAVTNVPMGEIRFAQHQGVLKTLLGSCIGIALYHPMTRTASLAHVLLPDSSLPSGIVAAQRGDPFPPGRYVDTAIDEMLMRLRSDSINAASLQAVIGGGADMFGVAGADSVGVLNRDAAVQALERYRIPIILEQSGGSQALRMSLDVATGKTTFDRVDPQQLRPETRQTRTQPFRRGVR